MSRLKAVRGPAIFCALLFLLMGASTSIAGTKELRYGFVEGGWLISEDTDEIDAENGWFAGGSFELRRIHIFGEYRDPGAFETWEAGAGWHGLFGDALDLVIEGAYVDADFDEGFRASGGLRWLILDDLELNAFYNHVDVGDFENDGVSVGGLWEFLGRFAVGGEWEFADETDTGRLFFRFYFKK